MKNHTLIHKQINQEHDDCLLKSSLKYRDFSSHLEQDFSFHHGIFLLELGGGGIENKTLFSISE